jgi:hypothetical protein
MLADTKGRAEGRIIFMKKGRIGLHALRHTTERAKQGREDWRARE